MVHANAPATISTQIDRLMNGQLTKTGERCAELPNLIVDDFTRLCEYAYRGDYAAPNPTIDNA